LITGVLNAGKAANLANKPLSPKLAEQFSVFAKAYLSPPNVKSHYLCGQNDQKMTELVNVLRYTIPAVVVFITAYFLLKEFFHQESKKRELDVKLEKVRISMPIRLQAYERIILLLERISPANLVMRVHQQGMTSAAFQKVLVQNIRDEYTHNLSQQLYVSSKAWDLVKTAREEMIRQINTSAAQLGEEATSIDLSNKLLEMSMEKMATRKAIDFLKEEARQNF